SPIEETWTLRDLGGQVLRTWGTVGGSSGTWNHREDHIHRDGQLLASWRPAEGLRFFHLDHLGTSRLITKADGRSAGLHTYFPFGEESVPNGSSERMKFTGHERDTHGTVGQGDDLDYMHARYCNPLNGRFLSVDPIDGEPWNPQTWNRYAYVGNNPLNFIDPDGLFRGETRENPIDGGQVDVCEDQETGEPCRPDHESHSTKSDKSPDFDSFRNFVSEAYHRDGGQGEARSALMRSSFSVSLQAAGVGVCDANCQVLGHVAENFYSNPAYNSIADAQQVSLSLLVGVPVGARAAVAGSRIARSSRMSLFGKTGLLNHNRYLRIGYGRRGGERVFRIGGSWVHKVTGRSKVDLWTIGRL
ncbi:MAG: RHS repeat-associated core domain-containing protein, partial [Acidobacteriota bacterium]